MDEWQHLPLRRVPADRRCADGGRRRGCEWNGQRGDRRCWGWAMKAFGYAVAPDLAAALAAIEDPGTLVIAGGIELVNLLKEGIVTPARLIDISKLPLDGVEVRPDGLRL